MTAIPPALQQGDKVAIISTACKISSEEIESTKQLLTSWNLNVVIGKTINAQCNQFAGSDDLRAEDLQTMLDDKEITAVFFARGGYGSVRILDMVDWQSLTQNPKWLIGYSDVTAVLMHAYYNANTASVHGIMPVNITDTKTNVAVSSLRNILFGVNNTITAKPHKLNRCGEVSAEVIGGNLSVIYSLLASDSFQNSDDKILVIEDLDEYLYHIDRMMQGLKRAGKLKNLKALIVGQFSDMHDNTIPFGKTACEIIAESVKDYDFPLAFDFPIGHIATNNHAFIHGKAARFNVTPTSVTLIQ